LAEVLIWKSKKQVRDDWL